jgi:tripeptidyl-peptidase-1
MKFSLAALTLLAVTNAEHVVREKRKAHPNTWVPSGAPSADSSIKLSFFLNHEASAAASLESEFLNRSDPKHEDFGKWLSNEQVHDMLPVPQNSIDAVTNYLLAHDISASSIEHKTSNSDIITVTVPLSTAEALLQTKYHNYKHSQTGHVIARSLEYSLPAELGEHVALVGPSTRFPKPAQAQRTAVSDVEAGYKNDPNSLRSLYSVNDELGGKAEKNNQAVTAFLGQFYSESDLNKFWDKEFPAGKNTPIKLVGDATEGRAGVESMLDIEYMPAMGALNPTEFWGFSGASPQDAADEPFLTWLETMDTTADEDIPLVFSTSYGEDETAEVPSDYADRINTEFQKAGLRGISLLFASGDSGAASDTHVCVNDQFVPMWPAGSPYVTAVGGTTNGVMPESAWSGSSGGFSNQFATPSWQADAVAKFVSSDDASMPPSSYYNATGRGFPDISAQAVNYPVTVHGFTTSVAGTSCASPAASGIFGLLNDARLSAGKSSLGFLNQILYANPTALNDVTQGVQGGCGRQDGFPAIEGWDAVTGLGSPNYEKLKDVVLALP